MSKRLKHACASDKQKQQELFIIQDDSQVKQLEHNPQDFK